MHGSTQIIVSMNIEVKDQSGEIVNYRNISGLSPGYVLKVVDYSFVWW